MFSKCKNQASQRGGGNYGIAAAVLCAACVTGAVRAGDPPANAVFWDAATRTVTYELPTGITWCLGDDWWTTNRIADTEGNLLTEAEWPTSVDRYVFRGATTNVILKAWWGSSTTKGPKVTAPNATFVVEKGVFWPVQGSGDAPPGLSAKRPDITVEVREEGILRLANESASTFAESQQLRCGNQLVLVGGTVEDNRLNVLSRTVTTDDVSKVTFAHPAPGRASLWMTGELRARAAARPSVVRAACLQMDPRYVGFQPVFNVDAGAELRIEAQVCDFFVKNGDRCPGGFTKRGAGTLTLTQASDLTGTVHLQAGTLRLAPGASLGAAKLIVDVGAKIALADGTELAGPTRVLPVPPIVSTAEIRVDASAFQQNYVSGCPLRNLGTVGGLFTQVKSGAPGVVANRFPTGLPASRANGYPLYLTGFTNTSTGVTIFNVTCAQSSEAAWAPTIQLFDRTYCVTNEVANDTESSVGLTGTGWKFANGIYAANGTQKDEHPFGFTYRYVSVPGKSINLYPNRPKEEPYVEMVRSAPANDDNTTRTGNFTMWYSNLTYTTTATFSGCRPGPLMQDCAYWSSRVNKILELTDKNNGKADTGEVLVFFRALTDSEAETVRDYLMAKWLGTEAAVTNAVVGLEVENGATARVALAGADTVVKNGAGTLAAAAPADVATNTLNVAAGGVSFAPGRAAAKVAAWLDMSRADGVETNAAGCVVALKNLAPRGGAFACISPEKAGCRLGNSYSTAHTMLEFTSNETSGEAFDFENLRAADEPLDAPVTLFVVAAQNLANKGGSNVNWDSLLDFSRPRAELPTDADPAPTLRLASSDPGHRAAQRVYWLSYDTNNSNDSAQFNSRSEWTDDEFKQPTLLCLETTRIGTTLYCEHPKDEGAGLLTLNNGCVSERSLGLVRVGARIVKAGNSFEYWKGALGELLVFTRALTAEEKQSVIDYLRAKWITDGGADVAPPAVAAGGPAEAAAEGRANLTLADGTSLAYAGAAADVETLRVPAGAAVAVTVDRKPEAGERAPLIRYQTSEAAGTFAPAGPFARQWSVSDDGRGTVWLRGAGHTIIVIR